MKTVGYIFNMTYYLQAKTALILNQEQEGNGADQHKCTRTMKEELKDTGLKWGTRSLDRGN